MKKSFEFQIQIPAHTAGRTAAAARASWVISSNCMKQSMGDIFYVSGVDPFITGCQPFVCWKFELCILKFSVDSYYSWLSTLVILGVDPWYTEIWCQTLQEFEIPADVNLKLAGDDDSIMPTDNSMPFPVVAFIECELRFPLDPFFRQILHFYKLNPMQLAINSYQVIIGTIALVKQENARITLADFQYCYTMFLP
ncbi:hypothetical protein CsSME_00008163 [Camellia sinensis var. sinensis]